MARKPKSDHPPARPVNRTDESTPGGPAGARPAACLAARGGGPAHARSGPRPDPDGRHGDARAAPANRRVPPWATWPGEGPFGLVYGRLPSHSLVFIEAPKAVELALLHDAIWNSATWGEFRATLPAGRRDDALAMARGCLGLAPDAALPADDEPFDARELGIAGRSWPEGTDRDPEDRELGDGTWAFRDGTVIVRLLVWSDEEVAEDYRRQGHQVERDDELVSAATGYVGRRFRATRRPALETPSGAN